MVRAVLDTNVLIAAALASRRDKQDSPAFKLLQAANLSFYQLVVTDHSLRELSGVLRRPAFHLPDSFVSGFVEQIALIGEFALSQGLDLGSHDPKDNIIVEAAINGRINYLVSRDADFVTLPLALP